MTDHPPGAQGDPVPAPATGAAGDTPVPEAASSGAGDASAAKEAPAAGRPGAGRPGGGHPPELTALLGTSSLFAGLSAKHLARLAGIGGEERFPRGAKVFREGAPGDKVYVVLEGAVRISRETPGMGEEALAILRPGSAFGEMSLVDDSPRSADAVAHEACRLFVMRKEDLEDLLFVDRELAYDLLWKIVRLLSTRLRETTDKIMFLTIAGKFE